MPRKPRNYAPEENVGILKRQLVEKMPVSRPTSPSPRALAKARSFRPCCHLIDGATR